MLDAITLRSENGHAFCKRSSDNRRVSLVGFQCHRTAFGRDSLCRLPTEPAIRCSVAERPIGVVHGAVRQSETGHSSPT